MRDNRLRPSAHSSTFLSYARFNTVAGFFAARLRRLLLRQAICIALIFSLLFLPGSSYAFVQAAAQTMTFTITRPDSTTMLLTRSTNASSPASGKVVQSGQRAGRDVLLGDLLDGFEMANTDLTCTPVPTPAPLPNPLGDYGSPCSSVWANTLRFDKERTYRDGSKTAREHIYRNHISETEFPFPGKE
jgi:hypothetical protein